MSNVLNINVNSDLPEVYYEIWHQNGLQKKTPAKVGEGGGGYGESRGTVNQSIGGEEVFRYVGSQKLKPKNASEFILRVYFMTTLRQVFFITLYGEVIIPSAMISLLVAMLLMLNLSNFPQFCALELHVGSCICQKVVKKAIINVLSLIF